MDGVASLFMPRNLSYISGLYQHARLADDIGVSAAAQGHGAGHGAWQGARHGAWHGDATENDAGGPRGRKPLRSECPAPPAAPAPIVRRRAKSLPSVPGRPASPSPPCRRKSVRFADSLGLELTVVRHFSSAEEPQVPRHVLESLHRGALDRFARLDAWDGAGGGVDCCGRCGPGEAAGPSAGRTRLEPAFPAPLAAPDFEPRLRAELVRLEAVTPGELSVAGRARVVDVAYEKEVTVRFSYNAWSSHAEVRARFAPPEAAAAAAEGPGWARGTDAFAFALPTPPFLRPGGALEFAVRYRVAGREYWDNNGGANYRLEVRGERPLLPPPREQHSGWIHFV